MFALGHYILLSRTSPHADLGRRITGELYLHEDINCCRYLWAMNGNDSNGNVPGSMTFNPSRGREASPPTCHMKFCKTMLFVILCSSPCNHQSPNSL